MNMKTLKRSTGMNYINSKSNIDKRTISNENDLHFSTNSKLTTKNVNQSIQEFQKRRIEREKWGKFLHVPDVALLKSRKRIKRKRKIISKKEVQSSKLLEIRKNNMEYIVEPTTLIKGTINKIIARNLNDFRPKSQLIRIRNYKPENIIHQDQNNIKTKKEKVDSKVTPILYSRVKNPNSENTVNSKLKYINQKIFPTNFILNNEKNYFCENSGNQNKNCIGTAREMQSKDGAKKSIINTFTIDNNKKNKIRLLHPFFHTTRNSIEKSRTPNLYKNNQPHILPIQFQNMKKKNPCKKEVKLPINKFGIGSLYPSIQKIKYTNYNPNLKFVKISSKKKFDCQIDYDCPILDLNVEKISISKSSVFADEDILSDSFYQKILN